MSSPTDDTLERMRADWDRRAAEDARFYIASGAARSEAEFRQSGVRDLEDAVLDGVRLSPSASALEIGCGIGRLLVPLAARVGRAFGVDISPAMIERSKVFTSKAPNVSTWCTDGSLAPLPDTSMDFVFSYIVFQHIPDQAPVRRYVEEAARVLKPGGLFRFQVDGRWKRGQTSDVTTYDGVKFAPADVRALLAGTGLEIADDWGAETHYHWVTARRDGKGTGVSFTPRAWDPEVVLEAIARCGSRDPASDTARVVSGAWSLRKALEGAEKGVAFDRHGDFVRDAWERIFGMRPETRVFDVLTRLLEAKVEFREDLVDIILNGLEARDLFRPQAAPVPWPRLASLALPDDTDPLSAVDAAEKLVSEGGAEAAVGRAFSRILGQVPDAAARAHYVRVVDERPHGRRQLVRALLSAPDAEPPAPPPAKRVADLLARHAVPPPASTRPGESFAGESGVARRILAGGGTDDAFVQRAYRGVLGREPDEGGLAWYQGRLASDELNRATLLRELLWSEELRGS